MSIGTLPESIGELSNLRDLMLFENSFTGELKTNPGSVLLEASTRILTKNLRIDFFRHTTHRAVPRGAGAAYGASDAAFKLQPVRRYEHLHMTSE